MPRTTPASGRPSVHACAMTPTMGDALRTATAWEQREELLLAVLADELGATGQPQPVVAGYLGGRVGLLVHPRATSPGERRHVELAEIALVLFGLGVDALAHASTGRVRPLPGRGPIARPEVDDEAGARFARMARRTTEIAQLFSARRVDGAMQVEPTVLVPRRGRRLVLDARLRMEPPDGGLVVDTWRTALTGNGRRFPDPRELLALLVAGGHQVVLAPDAADLLGVTA